MTGEPITIIGSGRTDAGVHAYAQVANFHTHSGITCLEMKHYLNHYLPMDIGVLQVDEVGERFHSRLNAVSERNICTESGSAKFPVFLTESIRGIARKNLI